MITKTVGKLKCYAKSVTFEMKHPDVSKYLQNTSIWKTTDLKEGSMCKKYHYTQVKFLAACLVKSFLLSSSKERLHVTFTTFYWEEVRVKQDIKIIKIAG